LPSLQGIQVSLHPERHCDSKHLHARRGCIWVASVVAGIKARPCDIRELDGRQRLALRDLVARCAA
jgi:hypothetical protein